MLARAIARTSRIVPSAMATAVRAASSSAVAAPAAAATAGAVPSWARNLSGQGAKGKVVLLYR